MADDMKAANDATLSLVKDELRKATMTEARQLVSTLLQKHHGPCQFRSEKESCTCEADFVNLQVEAVLAKLV